MAAKIMNEVGGKRGEVRRGDRTTKSCLVQRFFLSCPSPFFGLRLMNFEEKERRSQANIRVIYDLTMGILWTFAGFFLLMYRFMGFDFDFDPVLTKIFGGTCVLYGLFRFYRAYKSRRSI
jgi:hypothetical protein